MAINQTQIHENLSVGWPVVGGTVAKFIWDPFLNSTTTQKALQGKLPESEQPLVVVIGSGLWYLRHKESGGLKTWRYAIDRISKDIQALWEHAGSQVLRHVYISPITDVVSSRLSKDRQQTLTPESISLMNQYLQTADLPVLGAWQQMAAGAPQETSDGLHYSAEVNNIAVNVLLNRVCNARVLSRNARPPFHATCCFEYPRPSWYTTAVVLGVLIMGLLLTTSIGRHLGKMAPSPALLRATLAFSLVLLLMYLCDRTPLFDKLHKIYSSSVFFFLTACALLAGFFGWHKHKEPDDRGFLNRQQTDEWKGWMQLLILVYHLTNASAIPSIYSMVRVLVSMYLFMTGYGHATYLCRTNDFSLHRLSLILLRTNLLAISLAYLMDTKYTDYYFAPLCSIWTLVVWLTLYVARSTNKSWVVWAKLAAMAAFTWLINSRHWWPFNVLSYMGVAWDQREWEFRFGLDMFVVYIGAITALVNLNYGKHLTSHPRWPQLRRWTVLLALVAAFIYVVFALTRDSKYAYNHWHPYISPLAVLCFVVLRNSTEYLRSASSYTFAAVGRISLELFIAQFHLFLAADTKAMLILAHPRLWWLINLLLVSIMFAGLCKVLAMNTQIIVKYMIHQSENKPRQDMEMAGDGGLARPVLDRLALDQTSKRHWLRRLGSTLGRSLVLRWVLGICGLLMLNHFY
ncbi:hypothetical protein H4R99_003578 [Coemansia sp. RSA 1722]|nr:hypothetical protein H4R99_003578 [Coemansia sp. RSA 1722]KAJ2600244.1 hypothetical protein GGF39_001869 [Coemansia sp. RSA 1721]